MFKKIVGLGFSSKGKNAKDIHEYIKDLVENGATEFFTGYNPTYWSDKFGFEVSPNGRFSEHEQITDYETLKQIVKEVHSYGFEVFINLNAWYYTDVTFPYIKRMITEFQELELDGVICGNIGILEYLKEINFQGKINISTIFALYNSEAIKFFLENYKINKVILSRELTLSEIKELVREFPNTKFEVFGEGDFCRYNNGLCFAEHKYGSRDICTVVVNDLVYKKKFKSDYKEILTNKNLTDIEKIELMSNDYISIFDEIKNYLIQYDLGVISEVELRSFLLPIYQKSKKRADLFYDSLESFNSRKNSEIIIYKKGLDILLTSEELKDSELKDLQEFLKKSIEDGYKYFIQQLKVKGEPQVEAEKLKIFYSKGDSLNLFSYLYFSQFKNIETVKFPTRGRGANEKLKQIESVVNLGKIDSSLITNSISPERCHYDLRSIFNENKLWFRELLKNKEKN